LGNIVPPVGTTLMLIATEDPNTKYAGTTWHNEAAGNITIEAGTFKKWIRIA
jgi:hypothetical protein